MKLTKIIFKYWHLISSLQNESFLIFIYPTKPRKKQDIARKLRTKLYISNNSNGVSENPTVLLVMEAQKSEITFCLKILLQSRISVYTWLVLDGISVKIKMLTKMWKTLPKWRRKKKKNLTVIWEKLPGQVRSSSNNNHKQWGI